MTKMRGTYVKASDLDLETPCPTVLGQAIEKLIAVCFTDAQLILTPEDPTIYINEVDDLEDGRLQFVVCMTIVYIDMKEGMELSTGTYLQNYVENKARIVGSVRRQLAPYVDHEILETAGLSAEQLIVRLEEIDSDIDVFVTSMSVDVNVYFTLTLIIEDISVFAPGERMANEVRYNNLCSSYTVQSVSELREWAKGISIEGADIMSKDNLRSAIADHYGFE